MRFRLHFSGKFTRCKLKRQNQLADNVRDEFRDWDPRVRSDTGTLAPGQDII